MNLSQREINLLKLLGIIFAVTIVYYFIISPLLDSSSDNISKNINIKSQIQKLSSIHSKYLEVKSEKERIKRLLENKNENINSLIQQWANKNGIAKNVAYTRSRESTIKNKFTKITTDIRINGVVIDKLFRFLFEIENSNKLIDVVYLQLKPGLRGTNTYDVIIKIESFKKK